MALTDTSIRRAEPRERGYKLTDERGMHLLVRPNGSKLWQLRYRHEGRQKTASLGQYPDVSLKAARARRDELRKTIADGLDPVAQARAERTARSVAQANSFKSVADQCVAQWCVGKSERHATYVMRRLEADVFPAIGARPVSDIKAPELVTMIKAIAGRGALDIAKRCYETTGQIFRYAIAHGLADRNPAADVKPADILPSRRKENYARIDARELPELLRKIEAYQGAPTTRLAIKLMAMTFVRTSELIGARWDEFDLDAARWDIPAARMKMRTPHIVPLSTQAVEVLRTLHTITGGRELLFPGERDHQKPMSNNTILKALERMGYKGVMTGHGFRGLASTILHEQGFDHAHIELQLAHQERNAVSASYNHAQYLEPRTRMMQAWADHLDRCRASNVVQLKAA